MNKNLQKGFTLLELLIVIAVIAILSVILVLVLNPSEVLKKSRDAQRISDLNTLKTAIGLYVTATTSPLLDNTVANTLCVNGTGQDTIWSSVPTSTSIFTSPPAGFAWSQKPVVASTTLIDGNGWIPVNLTSLTGGSPIASMPLDPTNTAAAGAQTNNTLMYRYACDKNDLSFEFSAKMESTEYTVNDNRAAKDGGNNPLLYEVGTKLSILPVTNDY